MTFHNETDLFVEQPLDTIWVAAWDYYETRNDDDGGGGGQEWRRTYEEGLKTFAWACEGWQEYRTTIRLVAMTAPKGSKWSPNDAHITKAVSEASWLIEQPEKYPASFALLGECKWNGGAS